jgi:hypothetical protein
MGWRFKWVSSGRTDYNYDFQASFRPEDITSGIVFYNYETVDMRMTDREGISVFYKDKDGAIFHTYSTYARNRCGQSDVSVPGSGSEGARRKTGPTTEVGAVSRSIQRLRIHSNWGLSLRAAAYIHY